MIKKLENVAKVCGSIMAIVGLIAWAWTFVPECIGDCEETPAWEVRYLEVGREFCDLRKEYFGGEPYAGFYEHSAEFVQIGEVLSYDEKIALYEELMVARLAELKVTGEAEFEQMDGKDETIELLKAGKISQQQADERWSDYWTMVARMEEIGENEFADCWDY